MEKIKKVEVIQSFNSEIYSLDEFILTLQELRDAHKNHDDLQVEIDEGLVKGFRDETDKEYKRRMESEAKRKLEEKEMVKIKEARERKEYERLKKKYGPDN